jgi:hypothetical protein
MRLRWIVMFVVLAVIVLVAGAPIISVVIAGVIASSHGCALNEGFVNPCVVGGEGIGETLYTMGVAGWFMLVTIPAGLIAAIVWGVIAVIMLMTDRRRAAPPPTAES